MSEWVSECCLYSKWAICQLNYLQVQFFFCIDYDDVRFVSDRNAKFRFHSTSSMKQQDIDRHIIPLNSFRPYSLMLCVKLRKMNYNVVIFVLPWRGHRTVNISQPSDQERLSLICFRQYVIITQNIGQCMYY